MLSIKGLKIPTLLAAFYNSSGPLKPQTYYKKESTTDEEMRYAWDFILSKEKEYRDQYQRETDKDLKDLIEKGLQSIRSVDLIAGRAIKLDLSNMEFLDYKKRDYYYGKGNTAFIISLLRCGITSDSEIFRSLHLEFVERINSTKL